MKRTKLLSVLLAIFIAIPATSQIISNNEGGMVNPELMLTNYQKFVMKAGNYTKMQLSEPIIMKVGSASTLGGFTLRAEKTTDMATGASKQAVKIMPNSATGIGKIVGKATAGLAGGADGVYYIDYEDLPGLLKAIEKMKKDTEVIPSVYTRYVYTCRGGFSFSSAYVVAAKKAIWMGEIIGTGDMPLSDFFDEMVKAFTEIQKNFASFK